MIISTLLITSLIALASICLIVNKSKYNLFFIAISIIVVTVFLSNALYGEYNTWHTFLSKLNSIVFSAELIFAITFIIGMMFVSIQPSKTNPVEISLICIYFASAMGVILNSNIITIFVFWEILSLCGSFLVAIGKNKLSVSASILYFITHCVSGVLFLTGIVIYYFQYNSLIFENFEIQTLYSYFILSSILINLGMIPFSSWLVKGYSNSSSLAAIFLSIYTTKTAFLLLVNLFYGYHMLVYVGMIMVVYAIFFCIIETNIRKILALAIIHHIGLAIMAVSEISSQSDAAIVISYIFTGVLYKIIFFMIFAILINNFKTSNIYILSKTINLKSPLGILLILASSQALGTPFTAGFVSKTHILGLIENLHNQYFYYFWMIFSAAISLNVGIKIPYYLINFKNTSQLIVLKRTSVSVFIFVLLFLQTLFLLPSIQLLTFSTIIHSAEIIAVNILIFVLAEKIFKGKEKTISEYIYTYIYKLSLLILNILKNITQLAVIDRINNTILYFTVSLSKIPYNKHSTTSKTGTSILIVFVIIYLLIRFTK